MYMRYMYECVRAATGYGVKISIEKKGGLSGGRGAKRNNVSKENVEEKSIYFLT